MNALGMLVGSAIIMIPVAILFARVPDMSLSMDSLHFSFRYSDIVNSCGYLLYFKIPARVGSANLMLVTLLIPPIAVTLSVVFLGEKLGWDY
ncbi:MAG: drug/metabolite transporter (DMT)-like permease [Granulosicoccus sp.]|jgi:drug/metabolite transporter (DMT)-like permease